MYGYVIPDMGKGKQDGHYLSLICPVSSEMYSGDTGAEPAGGDSISDGRPRRGEQTIIPPHPCAVRRPPA